MCVFYQHPSSPVTFDPPPFDPREKPMKPSKIYAFDRTEDDAEILDLQDGIFSLICQHGARTVFGWAGGEPGAPEGFTRAVERYSAERVSRWVRYLAIIAGQDI